MGCTRPTNDQSLLRQIRSEAELMMQAPPPTNEVTVPANRWPEAIASLKPYRVTVSADGVDIMIQHDLDGGWGYLVPSSDGQSPDPPGRFSKLTDGVYWYHPY